MKTKFTTITMFALILITFTVSAGPIKSQAKKLDFRSLKSGTIANHLNPGQFKHLFVAEKQLSVPQLSEDFSWETNLSDWTHDTNTTHSYDESGRLVEEVAREAETSTYLSRISYSYDFHGNVTEEVSYVRGNNEWIPVSGDKLVYTINAESQINGFIEQTFKNGAWVNESWTEYVLNASNIPIGMLTYHWNGADWMLYSKTTNITWADWPTRKLAAYTLLYWQDNTWFNGERYFTQYDGENYTATTETWVNVEWVNTQRETYSRTEFNEEIVIENLTESGWEIEKYRGTFDAYGNPTGMFYSTWYENEWVTEMELFFDLKFNESNDVTEMVFRYRDPGLSIPKNIAKYKYSNFLHFTTGVHDLSVLYNVKTYPNPVKNVLNISIDDSNIRNYQVNITDLSGKIIFQDIFSGMSATINTERFIRGVYVLSIKADDGRLHQAKILKQ